MCIRWLEGHIKEQNYGADWGDFVSFASDMKSKAKDLGVDLLLVDTGDLHDGNGLSDATTPNGAISNLIFENVDYDILTIGNHELYISEITTETYNQFSKKYGDKYITSNVQILNPATGKFEYIGSQYRYFTTAHGLRIMAFGVLFDFTGNSNISKVIKTADLVKETWFLDAVNFPKAIDLFMVIGHNPIRPSSSSSTFGTLYSTIRGLRPNIPIQAFGGHSHIRDFVVYDQMSTGLESGRYCETLGFLSMTGINSTTFNGKMYPKGVPHPTQKAVKVGNSTSTNTTTSTNSAASAAGKNGTVGSNVTSNMVYSRRYLDWNRLTFAYHAEGSQDKTFDTSSGLSISSEIAADRVKLNLTALYGCAPATYCQSCKPFGTDGNIFGLLETALADVVINSSRANTPRLIIINTGSIRFDLVKGPFTFDDSFIVSPFTDGFQFIPNVPYATASKVLRVLNAAPADKRNLQSSDFGFHPPTVDACIEGVGIFTHNTGMSKRSEPMTRRQLAPLTPGYVTKDDFGTNGDDTAHSAIPSYRQPENLQANASFPTDGSLPQNVDLIFLDYIAPDVLPVLKGLGAPYTTSDVSYYLPKSFTTNSYLPAYAKKYWQAGVPNCPVGQGIGYGRKAK